MLALVLWGAAGVALGQVVDLANRPISEVKFTGLQRVKLLLVTNQVRSVKGSPYDPKAVDEDIRRLTHLGQFRSVTAQVMPQKDGSVVLTFVVDELQILVDVRVVGNKHFSDQDILGSQGATAWTPGFVVLRGGDGADGFLIDRGMQRVKSEYEKAGFFQAEVSIDKEALAKSNILIHRVREGPRVTIRELRFEGNRSYSADQLDGQVKSEEAVFLFKSGHLSRETLDGDVDRIRQYYRDRGYLEADVGRRIDVSPDEKDAVVTFLIEEGPLYTVSKITIKKWIIMGNRFVLTEDPLIFPREQILEQMSLKVGDVFAADKVRQSREGVYNLYGKLGHVDMKLRKDDGSEGIDRRFLEKEPKVEVIVAVYEARPSVVGKIEIRGNVLTKDNVVLRGLRGLDPGRPFDRQGIELTQRRLRDSRLFEQANVTIRGETDDPVRDVLIDVKENPKPGALSFGAAVSSDSGLFGAIDLVQRNFDIADVPDDISELLAGKAFRGAGQFFNISLQPGNEYSNYAVRFREPYLLDTPYSLGVNFRYSDRQREEWDEKRLGGHISIGQSFGDVWQAQVTPRVENVDITDIDADAPVDVFEVEGKSTVTGLEFAVVRDTTDSRIFPTQGNLLEMRFERVGALGGDYDFSKVGAEFRQFWKVDEDFFGRATVLSLRVEASYILDEGEAPIFERFNAGGHKTLRGFEFRGIGPRGIQADTGELGDDPVGGDWLFLAGIEYNWPIYQDVLRGVIFIDSGTVQKDFGFDEYRVSIGAGLRVKLPIFGQVPFALDFAFPLLREDTDEEQYFSFDLAIPF